MDSTPFLTGQLLLAMPGIGDARFEHAIIAICSHDEEGALGISVGAVIDGLRFHDLLRQLDIDPGNCENADVHYGGPVEPRRGFVVHSGDWQGQDTVDVDGRWSLSGTLDVLRAIAEERGPAKWLVALGYAGWTGGQLDEELTRYGWFNTHSTPDLFYDVDAEDRWAVAFAGAGIDPRMLASSAGTA